MMKLDKLLAAAKQIALQLAKREIDRILAKAEQVPGVQAQATEEGVVLTGKDIASRAVIDPQVRDIAR